MAAAGGGGGGTSRFRATTTGGNITKITESVDAVNPYIQVSYKVPGSGGVTVTETTTLSGTQTDTLSIKCDVVKTQSVYCVVSGASIPSTPTTVTSDTANFYSISQSNLEQSELNLEIIDDFNGTIASSTTNLFQQNLNLIPTSTTSQRSFIVYADKNIPVRITLDGGGGLASGSNAGGSGGRTVFDYTLLANTEYVFKLGQNLGPARSVGGGGPAAYFYEKGTLLVVSGGGGGAGAGGVGGAGGGAGIQGTNGGGTGSGTGGQGLLNGTLPADGILVSGRDGGRVESCTTGYYYESQGKSPCEDIGTLRFRTATGSEVSASASTITRGYKADIAYPNGQYGYRYNGGGGANNSTGGGGSGAVGGSGASSTGGGGGGSGYSNGTVTIVSTGLSPEGSAGSARAFIELRT